MAPLLTNAPTAVAILVVWRWSAKERAAERATRERELSARQKERGEERIAYLSALACDRDAIAKLAQECHGVQREANKALRENAAAASHFAGVIGRMEAWVERRLARRNGNGPGEIPAQPSGG